MSEKFSELNYGLTSNISKKTVMGIISALYGWKHLDVSQLQGYYDRNYHVKRVRLEELLPTQRICEDGYVLKIYNKKDSSDPTVIGGIVATLLHLNGCGISTSCPVLNITNGYVGLCNITDNEGIAREHCVTMVEYLPGEFVTKQNYTDEMCSDLGDLASKIHAHLRVALDAEPSMFEGLMKRELIFDLKNVGLLKKYVSIFENFQTQHLIESVIDDFTNNVLFSPVLETLGKGLIHGDLNDGNLLTHDRDGKGEMRLKSVIDFGDAHWSYYFFELAVAVAYIWMKEGCVSTKAASLLAAYQPDLQLQHLRLLKDCVRTRLVQSILLASIAHRQNPDNNYLLEGNKAKWNLLQQLSTTDNASFVESLYQEIQTRRNNSLTSAM